MYIKDGVILAGAGVGKTGKPVKLTKKQLAEHFEELQKKDTKKKPTTKKASEDKKGAKKGAKQDPKVDDVSRKPSKPATKSGGKKSGSKKASEVVKKGRYEFEHTHTHDRKGAKIFSTAFTKVKGKKVEARVLSTHDGNGINHEVMWSNTHEGNHPVALSEAHKKALFQAVEEGKGFKEASEKAEALVKKGAKKSGTATKKPTTKTATKSPTKATKTSGKAGATSGDTGKQPSKKSPKAKTGVKDIRTEAQKNRELAYDVGAKVGGARKDDWEARFKEDPNASNLEKLEKDNPAVAQKLVTKANLLPAFDFEAEHKNGVELPTAIMKKLIFDRIAPKPDGDTAEDRKAYMTSLNKLHRHFAGIKSWDNMREAIGEFANLARKGSRVSEADDALNRRGRYGHSSYVNTEYYQRALDEGLEAKAQMDFTPLGEKLESFFSDYNSRERTMNTVKKNMKEGWDKYLNPETKPKKGGTPRGGEKKLWERKAEAEHLRTGGRKTPVSKPEDMVKQFGIRGVEFGHWVDDASGKYHLQRSAEAFHDLADVLGIDDKDVSLNGRLAIAFGARGKGSALAHYEPDRKVINMTKYGGAGSLAHEWGHALDNIMYQYSHGGRESLGLASEDVDNMGDHDILLKGLYDNVMEAIRKPAPGDKGASKKITLDSMEKPQPNYYPEMRREVQSGLSPEEVYNRWAKKFTDQRDREIRAIQSNSLRNEQSKEKAIKSAERKYTANMNKLPHYVAGEFHRKQNDWKSGGKPFKAEIEIPTGNSEYYQRMLDMQPGKKQNGAHYWSSGAEMFARVFESYVQHKLDKGKRYNNYLVHGTRERDVVNSEAPFPKGKEREHMFMHMENLLEHVAKGKTLKKALELELVRTHLQNRINQADNNGQIC